MLFRSTGTYMQTAVDGKAMGGATHEQTCVDPLVAVVRHSYI